METTAQVITGTARLTPSEFEKIARIVYAHAGIKLESSKKVMVESRLNRRLRALQINTFEEYVKLLDGLQKDEGELVNMIDAVSTNKTDFFREPHHFEFLINEVVPDFFSQSRAMRVWSAACSSGEEPYTLAMVLTEAVERSHEFSFEVIASDISTQVLQKAIDAIYPADKAVDIPDDLKRKYLLKSKDNSQPRVRIASQIRHAVKFSRINLMEFDREIDQLQDVIFCRNVLIYFDRDTQYRVVSNLLQKLKPGGYLFIGHSESLHFFDLPIKQIRPTIFKKL